MFKVKNGHFFDHPWPRFLAQKSAQKIQKKREKNPKVICALNARYLRENFSLKARKIQFKSAHSTVRPFKLIFRALTALLTRF